MKKTIYYTFILVAMSLLISSCSKDEDDETSSNGGKAPSSVKAVDLGLPSGTLWATCNVGANSPEEYGNYYAWGETKAYGEEDTSNINNYSYEGKYTKTNYRWSTYKWCYDSQNTLTKYNKSTSDGKVDNKDVLDLDDDAAYVNWGENWRIPTHAEMKELVSNCTWTWTSINGKNGYKVSSKKDSSKYIFLPVAGYRSDRYNDDLYYKGCYWTSSNDTYVSYHARNLVFNSENIFFSDSYSRCSGLSVRPVRSK